MELRQYWQIIWRRIWIIPLLLAVVAGVSWFTYQTPQTTYQGSLRFAIIVEMRTVPDRYNFDGYYTWISSEYLTDLLTIVVRSENFIQNVNLKLTEMGHDFQISSGQIVQTESKHRTLLLILSWSDPDQLQTIGQAIVTVLEQNQIDYLTSPNLPAFIITAIDKTIVPFPVSPPLTDSLDLPIRLTLALLTGIGLIFLLEYLDSSLRSANELEEMGIPVLAQIPRQR